MNNRSVADGRTEPRRKTEAEDKNGAAAKTKKERPVGRSFSIRIETAVTYCCTDRKYRATVRTNAFASAGGTPSGGGALPFNICSKG